MDEKLQTRFREALTELSLDEVHQVQGFVRGLGGRNGPGLPPDGMLVILDETGRSTFTPQELDDLLGRVVTERSAGPEGGLCQEREG